MKNPSRWCITHSLDIIADATFDWSLRNVHASRPCSIFARLATASFSYISRNKDRQTLTNNYYVINKLITYYLFYAIIFNN